MRKRSKWAIAILATVSVAVIGVAAIRVHLHSEYCEEKNYAVPSGKVSAIVSEETCDGFGASDVVSVYIEKTGFAGFKQKSLVFKYDPSEFSGPLEISWSDEHALKISIDRVQFIEHQSPVVFDVPVVYQIGAVGNPSVMR